MDKSGQVKNTSVIAILQPFIPHYREDFFNRLGEKLEVDIFCYQNEVIKQERFHEAAVDVKPIMAKELKGFLIYNPFKLLKRKYGKLVLMLNIGHLTTWLLLLSKFIHRKQIILWGHGISVKRYIREERKPSRLMRWMIRLSDGVWFYTSREQQIWQKEYPDLKSVALNNTISEVDRIAAMPVLEKEPLRRKYGISQQRVFIFCARFNIAERRIDLLLEAIRRFDPSKFAFVIIGDGALKPDLSGFSNVHDFGSLYDQNIKAELFQLADIYFQPGWIGLSVVEAMAYGKPVFSLRRTDQLLQCVEYAYISEGRTGLLFDDIDELITKAEQITDKELIVMGKAGRLFAKEHLSMSQMVTAGISLITQKEL